MNVVSDFNEVPLQMQELKRKSKLRSSLTLEQELDRNLRKLNDLELGLSVQPDDMSPTVDRYAREMDSKYSGDEKEDADDVLSNEGTLESLDAPIAALDQLYRKLASAKQSA